MTGATVTRSKGEHYLHASLRELPVGTELKPSVEYGAHWGPTTFYDALERYRPKEMLAHRDAVFMCSSAEDLDNAIGGEFIFELNVDSANRVERHDMHWSSQVSCLVADGASETLIQAMAQKYWNGLASDNPVWEYLTESATIVAVHEYENFEDRPTPAVAPGLVINGGSPEVKQMFSERLQAAIDANDVDVCRELVEMGADVRAPLPTKETTLCRALKRRSVRVAQFLVDAGVDVNEREPSESGLTPLTCAASHEQYEFIEVLVAAGARAEAVSKVTESVMHELARMGKLRELRLLLDAGAPADCLNNVDQTSLHWAALVGNVETARLLVSYGADPFRTQASLPSWKRYDNYLSPFESAVNSDNVAAVEYFINECGADLGQRTVAGQSLLELAETSPRVKALLLGIRSESTVDAALAVTAEARTDGALNQRQLMSL